ncbi:IMP dehydrogenase, partial [bacterium]|nr:IMP dehydrogenase [bacterium]
KAAGAVAAVSLTPAAAKALGPVVKRAGGEMLFLQGTVVGISHTGDGALDVAAFIQEMGIPVVVGNCVTGSVAKAFMAAGAAGVLVGIGPGAACTTRAVTGVGVGQVTATMSCAQARDEYEAEGGRRVAIITDGGMRQGGEIAKAIASGADAVMLGSCFSGLLETPGQGVHWGMSTADPNLPRGTRVMVKHMVDLDTLLWGPSHRDDGTQNLMGGLANSMGMVGAKNIREMQGATVVHSQALRTEGKHYQFMDGVGQSR